MPSRVIRGEINRSDSLSKVSVEAELAFRALLTAVDDYGRFDARPAVLKAELFPLRQTATAAKVVAWIEELAALEDPPVVLYESVGRRYLFLPNWERHRGSGRRGPKSRYPEPEVSNSTTAFPRNPRISRESEESSALTSDEGRGTRDVVRVASAETPAPPATTETGAHAPLTDEQWSDLLAWADAAVVAGKLRAGSNTFDWLADQVDRCSDHWASKGKKISRWPAAVRNWIRKAEEFRIRDAKPSAAVNGHNGKPLPSELDWLRSESDRIRAALPALDEASALQEYERFREASAERRLSFSATSGIIAAIEGRIRELRGDPCH